MKKYIIFFILYLPLPLFAQNEQYKQIDQYVKNLSRKEFNNIETLAKVLCKPAQNDLEKVRAFYVWIGLNISYDIEALRTGNFPEKAAEAAFKSNKAVCQGYSELFEALCTANNIECKVVPGYSKGYGYRQGKSFKNSDHAWNVVKINGKWQLVDATWGAGYMDDNDNYVNMFTEEHFLSEPERFVIKHLPVDPVWQLLKTPVPLKTFEKDSNTVKQFVLTAPKGNVNYLDTLTSWENLDSLQKVFTSNLRIVRFNPENSYAWYTLGWFHISQAQVRMSKLNNPAIQSNRSVAVPLAKEASELLKGSIKYLNEAEKRDPVYAQDIRQKKDGIAKNLKNLEFIIGTKQ